ncbi:unnamed protein product [Schistosoma bovis]|nr:unnamed protein product [Schistosoma bovis]
MSEIAYKQLHQFHCGALAFPERSSLVSICPHGCFVCVSDRGVLLYDTKHYLEATGICNLRRDKPLPDHKPNIVVSSIDPIIWTAFNSDGLILAVLTSSESRGTFANLLNVVDLVKSGSTDLSNISRSIRVCGGETSLWRLRDFAWSPTDPTTFVVVLDSGAVRLFNFPPDGSKSITLVGQLSATADCRCVSWSPKGKQLAICLNGSLSTANGIVQGPLILQVDPQLQQKRIVPLGHLFESNHDWKNSLPVDLLWTSSYNFLLAIKQSVNEVHSDCLTNVLYISTTSKSPEPSAVSIGNLSSHMDHNKVQYYFRFLGPNHVIVTLACVGEEVIVLKLPTTSGSSPQVVMSIELPADGCAMSMDVGVLQNKTNESVENSLIYLLTYLSNGNICPYLLNSNDQLNLLNLNNPKLISLSIPKPVLLSTTEKSPLNTPKSPTLISASNNNPAVSMMMMTNQAKQNVITTSVDSANDQHRVSVNTAICNGNSSSNNSSSLQSITSSIPLNSLNKISTESKLSSSLHKNTITNSPVNHINNVNSTIVPVNKENFIHQCKTPINHLGDLPLPKSIQLAATHFTSALQLESEAGRHAWENLFNVLINGTIDKKSSESIGLDIIEARLHNVDRFFKAMNEVIVELTNALNERKEDLTNSVRFGERLRRALRLYASGDWFHTISGHLDPETNRLFSQLKRRARLAEAGLYDLENQIESLSTELNTMVQSKNIITATATMLSSPNQQRKDKLSISNSVNNDSNIMRTIDTNANLIRAERSRVDFIVENLKRLGLSPMKYDSKCEKKKGKQKSMCKSLNCSNISFLNDCAPDPNDDTDLMNPYRNMLIERDQALLRLFSNYKVPVIYPSKLCPSISLESETVKDQSQSFSDVQSGTLNHSQMKTTSSPGNMKNSKLEQLLVVSGEIASNTEVSIVPKSPSKPSTEKSVKVVNKTEAVPSSVSTPLSPNTPTSVISSKPPNIAFNSTRNQIANSSTVSSVVNSAPVSNVKQDDPNTTTFQQSFSLGMKPIQQPLFTQPNITSAFNVSSTANDSSNLFVKSTLFKPQSPSSSLPIVSTSSGSTSIGQSSAPFVVNNSNVSSPVFQKIGPTITTANNSATTLVTTVNETSFINRNSVIPTTNSLFNPSVISQPIVTNPSNVFNNTSPCKETDEIKKENLVSNISSANMPQTNTVSSKSSGLFSFLPTPVCSSSGIMFGSGQSQNISTATINTTISSSLSSLFTGIPLNTTSAITTNSDTTTHSNVTFNSRPLFGAPNLVSATTVASSTCSTGANIFLFGNPNQTSSTINTGSVTTVSPANIVIGLTGTPISKSEAFNKTPTTSVSSLFGGAAFSTPVSVPSCGIASNTHVSTLFGGSTPTTTIPASPMFGTTVFGKGTSSSGGLFTGTNVSSFQTITSSSILQSPGVAGLFSVSNSVNSLSSLPSTTTTIATTTSVTPSFSSPFGSSVFGGNSTLPGQSLFQNTTATNTIATVSSSTGLFGTLANTSVVGGNKLFSSQPATQTSGFLFGSPFNAPVSGGGSNLFQVNTSNPTTTVSSSTLFGASLFNTPSVNSPVNNNNTTAVSTVPAQITTSSLFSFVSGTSSLFSGASITSNQVNPTAPGTGLFAAVATVNSQQITSNSTGGGAGLFGSPMGSDTKSTNSLFSVSNLSLGGNSKPQNPTQNAFGKPFGNTAFANQANSTLFGSPNSSTQNNIISGASASLSSPQSGLFSSSILGSSLFGSPTPVTTMSGGGGGLFSNVGTNVNPGTGLFGTQTPTTGVGGFGSSPTFGSPAFDKPVGQGLFGMNGPGAFNSSGGLFGSTGPLFGGGGGGSNPAPVGGGLFASLGSKSDNLSFGSLAQNSPPGGNIPASPFGTSPSFTQRRA